MLNTSRGLIPSYTCTQQYSLFILMNYHQIYVKDSFMFCFERHPCPTLWNELSGSFVERNIIDNLKYTWKMHLWVSHPENHTYIHENLSVV